MVNEIKNVTHNEVKGFKYTLVEFTDGEFDLLAGDLTRSEIQERLKNESRPSI